MAQDLHHVARLAEIQTVERFVQQQKRLRREQAERQKDALGFTLRERSYARSEERNQTQSLGQRLDFRARLSMKGREKAENIADGLRRPRTNGVRKIEQRLFSCRDWKPRPAKRDLAGIGRKKSCEAFKQRGFARAIRAN